MLVKIRLNKIPLLFADYREHKILKIIILLKNILFSTT